MAIKTIITLIFVLSLVNFPVVAQVDRSVQPNILLIVSDDQGVADSPEYDYDPNPPYTPVLSKLAEEGVVFENAWATPMCFTTRAALITGKHGVHNGVVTEGPSIRLEDTTIFEFLENHEGSRDYATAFIGKWHVGHEQVRGESYPIANGVDYYAGLIEGNFGNGDYDSWNLTIDSPDTETIQEVSKEYNTSKLTRLAEEWIANQDSPWFMTLAYNAPHGPFHWPSESLHGMQERTDKHYSNEICAAGRQQIRADDLEVCYNAMIEAMDTEVGNLLNTLDQLGQKESTLIIYSGDNGSNEPTVIESGRAKSTLYPGGLHVPFFVSGAGVTRQGAREDRLVTITDVYATVAEIAGAKFDGTVNDSISLAGYFSSEEGLDRPYAFSDIDRANDRGTTSGWSIRNHTHMLMRLNGQSYLFEVNPNNFMYKEVTEREPEIVAMLTRAAEEIIAGE